MGEGLIKKVRQIKDTWKTAMMATFIIGLCAHLYKFVNYLPTSDSLYNVYSKQNATGLGRPFLGWFCSISSWFDLPLVEGILSLFYIALTVICLIEIFEIERKGVILLVSGMLVAFPTITATFAYMYTVDGYMLAMFLSALAVYFCVKREKGWIAGVVLLCLSEGGYQAYLSFALILFCCYFIYAILGKRYENKELLLICGKAVLMCVIATLCYYVSMNVGLKICNRQLSSYQGMNQLGLKISNIPSLLIKNYFTIMSFYLPDEFSLWALANRVTIVCGILTVCGIIIRNRIYKNFLQLIIMFISGTVIIPSACIWMYASEKNHYHALMLTSLVLPLIFVAILLDRFVDHIKVVAEGAFVFFAVVICNYILISNISYISLNFVYERNYSWASHILYDIEKMDEYEDVEYVAVIGSRDLNEIQDMYSSRLPDLTGVSSVSLVVDEAHLGRFLQFYLGKKWEIVSAEVHQEIRESEAVQNMDSWPRGGILIYNGDTVVIKLGEE